MGKNRYPYKLWQHSSHSQILTLLSNCKGRTLLDVGCADGTFSEKVSQLGWLVTCVEPNHEDAKLASLKNLFVINADIETSIKSINQKFDAIILADVLEHLHNPSGQVALLKNLLNPGGVFIISVPNVAHIYIRLMLLIGRFNYTDRGILDRTHTIFFTKKTILKFINELNLSAISVGVTPTPVELFLKTKEFSFVINTLLRLVYCITLIRPTLFGYQFIIVAKND